MFEDDDNPTPAPGLLDSVRRLGRTLVATLHNRVELLVVELQEEGTRFVGVLLLAACAALFSGLALIMGMFTVLLSVEEAHRPLAALLMTLTLFVCAGISAGWLWSKLNKWSAFSGTRAELRKDREWLQSKHPKA